jgi:hypothetical protein
LPAKIKEMVTLKKIGFFITVLILIGAVLGALIFFEFNKPKDNLELYSWIAPVEQMLQEAKPYPTNNSLSHPANPDVLNIYLNENGTQQLVYYGEGDNFSRYLTSLMEQVNVDGTRKVGEVYLGKIMQADKVVSLNYNLTMLSTEKSTQKFYTAYFVINDTLKENLTGAIFVRNVDAQLGHLRLWTPNP